MFSQVIIDTISFNDNTNYLINGFSGLEMPSTRAVTYNLAGEHFGQFVSALYGRRRWTLDGDVVGADQSDFINKRDELQSALDAIDGEITVKFTLSNSKAVQIDAIFLSLSFAPRPGTINSSPFQIEFESAFPFLVGQSAKQETLVLATGGGGKVPPDTMPMGLSYGTGGSVFPINNGNAIFYPTARINGPVSNPALRNETTNKEIQFNITLSSGEYLDVDFKRKTVFNHQGVNQYSVKAGDWWYLAPGQNQIKFLAGAYDADASVTFNYRDSYLGL